MIYLSKFVRGASAATFAGGMLFAGSASADIQHLDDVIITFSLCVGNDCVNGENFGFDTIRLKENNLRIHFNDTSNSGSFPTADWRLVANDTANGGANYFAIEDSDRGRNVFLVEAGAPANSLYVDDGGRVGIKTSTPAVQLHVLDGNTPTMRLQQDGSSGFTPQVWDIAGNEANFFIRDVTNGSRLSFKIKPAAPENSLFIAADGKIGLGTQSPSGALHVVNAAGTLDDFVVLASGATGIGTNAPQDELHIAVADGTGAGIRLEETGDDAARMILLNDNIIIQFIDGAGAEFTMDTAGNVTILGALTQNSDRNNKHAIVPVDPQTVLAKLAQLDISTWSYKGDGETRHIGPMAQDFYALFQTGKNERGISAIDTTGVALASIKALHSENAELKQRLAKLETRLEGSARP